MTHGGYWRLLSTSYREEFTNAGCPCCTPNLGVSLKAHVCPHGTHRPRTSQTKNSTSRNLVTKCETSNVQIASKSISLLLPIFCLDLHFPAAPARPHQKEELIVYSLQMLPSVKKKNHFKECVWVSAPTQQTLRLTAVIDGPLPDLINTSRCPALLMGSQLTGGLAGHSLRSGWATATVWAFFYSFPNLPLQNVRWSVNVSSSDSTMVTSSSLRGRSP